jgi:hypothetical protein
MKPLFSHNFFNSFFLWFDHQLQSKAEAHQTVTSKLYNYNDARLGGSKVVYGSPYKQWSYDLGVAGITFPSGATVGGSFVPTGTSGLFFDFENGRAIFDAGMSTGEEVSATYTVKDFSIYATDESEDSLIVENGRFKSNSRFSGIAENYVPPYDQVTPAIFLSIEGLSNEGFSFGGEDETTCMAKAVVFAENLYQLDGVLGVFADSYNECFQNVSMTGHPMGEFGNIKSGVFPTGYSYNNLAANANSTKFFISDVTTSKLEAKAKKELSPALHVGFIDFEVKNYRFPRQ